MLLGATLATRPADIYRSLLEATVFGTRMIIDSLEDAGVGVDRFVACGGLPDRNRLLMQLTADITGREVDVAASNQAPAVGSAMHAAVAAGSSAGGYDSIEEAAARMARPHVRTYVPDPSSAETYGRLYAEYRTLHDYFGRGGNDVMKRLRAIQHAASATATREPAAAPPVGSTAS
jgi:L-ribulokinase